jgi:hypothetical protein
MAPAECAIKYVSLGNRDYKYLIYGEANNWHASVTVPWGTIVLCQGLDN